MRAGAARLLKTLPRGLDTNLDCMGLGLGTFGENSFAGGEVENGRQGLSGGEVSATASSVYSPTSYVKFPSPCATVATRCYLQSFHACTHC